MMQTVDTPSSEFGVRLGQHFYPHVEQEYQKPQHAAPEIIEEDSTLQVGRNLVQAIGELLPFLSVKETISDKAVLFAQYVDSVSILEGCHREVTQLFEAMIETVLEFDSAKTLSPESRSQILAQALKDVDVRISRPMNLAAAELAALEPAEIQARLHAGLTQAVKTFIEEVLDQLGVLVDRSVAGLAHWTGPNTVKYHFFRRRIEETDSKETRIGTRIQERSQREAFGDFSRWKAVHETETTTQVTCWLVHHKHDTVNAIHTSLENTKVVLPEFVSELVTHIPDWMRPSICVIDGYLIHEQLFERELGKQEFTEVRFDEEILHGYEPAVCLGAFVLTGWGPREINIEVTRRQQETTQSVQLQNARFWGITTLACQVFCGLFAQLGMLSVAVILFAGGIVATILWINRSADVAGLEVSEWRRQRIALGCLAFMGGLQLLFSLLSWPIIFFGLVLIFVGTIVMNLDRGLLFRFMTLRGAIR